MGKKSSKKKAVLAAVMDKAGVPESEARELIRDAKQKKFLERRDGGNPPVYKRDENGKVVSRVLTYRVPKDIPNPSRRARRNPRLTAALKEQKEREDKEQMIIMEKTVRQVAESAKELGVKKGAEDGEESR